MSEMENPASVGTLGGAGNVIAGCESGTDSTANANGQAPIHRLIHDLDRAYRAAQIARQHDEIIDHLVEGVR
jgi:hypothetical protein